MSEADHWFKVEDALTYLVLFHCYPIMNDLTYGGAGLFILCFDWVVDPVTFREYIQKWLPCQLRISSIEQDDHWWNVTVIDPRMRVKS